ncbi:MULTISPECIES: hypothetical protein [Hyphobacterium]|uniref:Uncharacterized protein n=1 Tax=Hyphobacterium vulgare TaxID=1736751 RepID=A0ABV6ZU89_9PROT
MVRQDLHINQGETWQHVFTHRDPAGAAVDLTGFSARMAVRDRVGGTLEAYLSTEAGEQSGGSITLGGGEGTVTLDMSAEQSRRLASNLASFSVLVAPIEKQPAEVTFFYDLELVSASGAVVRAFAGRVIVNREVTE